MNAQARQIWISIWVSKPVPLTTLWNFWLTSRLRREVIQILSAKKGVGTVEQFWEFGVPDCGKNKQSSKLHHFPDIIIGEEM